MSMNCRFKSLFFVLTFVMIFGIIGTLDANAQTCDDGNPCTLDRLTFVPAPGCPTFCDNVGCCPGGGFECVGTPLPDGPLPFPPGAMCEDGVCVGCEVVDCDDGNLCTTDIFDTITGECTHLDRNFPPRPGSCQSTVCDPTDGSIEIVIDPSLCDDGNACNGIELCSDLGQCSTPAAPDCDDGNACNGVETCDEATGCVAGTALECDDSDMCNGVESCDEATGCVQGAAPLCNNGLFCDGEETCDAQLGCQPGTPPVVDDGIDCTIDSCDEENDAVLFAVDSALCDDGDFCNGTEMCDPDSGFGSGCVDDPEPPVGESCGEDGSGVCSEELQCVETTGTIKIVKMADPNDGTDFLFNCLDENNEPCVDIDVDGDGDSSFLLDDEEVNMDDTPNMMTFSGLPAGTYIFSESLPSGWGITDMVCVGDDDGETSIDNNQAVIDLDPFENITCTFFNEFLCGNGIVDEDQGEQCDPGINPDFCTDECTLLDSDGDGVIDEFDQCPETPAGEAVDEDGCPIEEMACDCDSPDAITEGFPFRGRTYFYGTFGDDIICGTSERDVIFSFSGDDCIDSREGRDLIFSGFGNDLIFSGDDNDRVFAGPGDDEADGGEGFDFIHGGFGFDLCFGERLRRCE